MDDNRASLNPRRLKKGTDELGVGVLETIEIEAAFFFDVGFRKVDEVPRPCTREWARSRS